MDIWAQIIGVDMTPEISFLSDGATTVVILYNHQVNNTINNNNNNNNISHVHCFAFHSFKGLARFPALSFGCAFFSFPPFSLAAHCFPRSCFDCIAAFSLGEFRFSTALFPGFEVCLHVIFPRLRCLSFAMLSTVGIACFPSFSWYAVLLSCSPALFRLRFLRPFNEN